jgi:hypothetical protein
VTTSYDEWKAGFDAARALSDKHNFCFWVYNGSLYVQDGGKRGYACSDGCTYDGYTYEVFGDASSRNASEEESEMWELITRLDIPTPPVTSESPS